jgi:hypothetical protein
MAFDPITYNRRRGRPRRGEVLRNTTIREFGGGWNVIDNDLNLSSRFAKVFKNVFRGADGAVNVRYGTRLFKTLPITDTIINVTYFSDALISVTENGIIYATLGDGTTFSIFDDDIAAALPGSPPGWSDNLTFCSFAQFRGELVICNGIDKPLRVYPTLRVEYLSDKATGSNVNVPIGKYVATADRYTIIGGIPADPTLLVISSTDTNGTFPGDPNPNDSVEFDLGAFVTQGSTRIKGVHAFRERLIVAFDEVIIVVQLGVFDNNGVHVPNVDDVVPQHGTVSHRAVQDLGDDMYFCDIRGVPSVRRSVFTEQIKPKRISQLIDPAIQATLQGLRTDTLEDRVFSVYHRKEGQYMLFVPNNNEAEDITETRGFIYTKIEELDVRAWSEVRGWNWRAACRSAQGRIFFARDNKLFVYGDNEDEIFGDFVLEQETFEDETVFTDGTGWIVTQTLEDDPTLEQSTGVPVEFDWQLPWADFDRRNNIKHMRYINLDADGRGEFTADIFVDNIVEERSDLGESFLDGTFFEDGYGFSGAQVQYDPAIRIPFRGGESPAFGLQPFGRGYFGGGRRTQNELLYAATVKGKIFKLRMWGATRQSLKFISISLDYQLGSIRR